MRLDKFLCDALGATRKEATKILKSGEVTVNEQVQKSGAVKVTEKCVVEWQGRELVRQGPRYIMLYKPEGFVCSHEDGFNHTAFVLLDEVKMDELHFAGRLDVDTTGLVLITDDGKWSHRITSPKHKCDKTYRVWLADPIGSDYAEKLAEGVQLRNEKELTLPAQMTIVNADENEVLLTIHEGKYHQVKRMFAALGNKVEQLHRERIGAIELDESLEPGEYRYLTQEEIDSVWK
ncbi:TPA: 16S rRNA pseudouridine(516) synthase RsuA [Vibrio vulnificus]|uniref:16S rRNA pseudouridine(516) synthase RsuA n=1 Tax=Vibrio vulnificus TaxID=672 RepID=UPI001A1D476B|nr:16S rRNA pseudouridine(516) synthase RsuA [Vibrio vulnificus]MCA0769722.1 16S rRNA pseudouridine(516) synthase RsuA [Vibrio vulnificus]NTJ36953.1 16S rRNA pseudouridine(516) synthase RsuA [Vibrio vulnificus]HAS6241379.1 16S rRNA pseudouridine(516) synthase RsuA [Vibrio vulnificus]HAS6347517.1 16S rRNA pseudouridine(516) synthase RsuA [Vibrio vulnificus]HAS6375825.1 16S rRNA pseudouridine(516) synthase RsuA [Vibrio vulnificus]